MHIVGIDEVGRGCWAGPVVAGAVLLTTPIEGLKDSKLLSKKERERLAIIIEQQAICGLGWVDARELDDIGLTQAVALAMERALAKITTNYDAVIIDGNFNFLPQRSDTRAIVKADATVPAVSAASILAKVARDAYMASVATTHSEYGFERHVGYGTALHLEKLTQHGVTPLHRRSFKPVQALL